MSDSGKEGNGNNECEISFGFNKYKKPELLDLRTSIANTVTNALFMVPGNIPSAPKMGVDINQYFYREESQISPDVIKRDLIATCGSLPGGAFISAVDYSIQQTTSNQSVFLLIIKIVFNSGEESLLGVGMQQNVNTREVVRFNFDYVDL